MPTIVLPLILIRTKIYFPQTNSTYFRLIHFFLQRQQKKILVRYRYVITHSCCFVSVIDREQSHFTSPFLPIIWWFFAHSSFYSRMIILLVWSIRQIHPFGINIQRARILMSQWHRFYKMNDSRRNHGIRLEMTNDQKGIRWYVSWTSVLKISYRLRLVFVSENSSV